MATVLIGAARVGAGAAAPPRPPAGCSSLARAVWKAAGAGWVRSEGTTFHVYARSPWEVADARAEAEVVWLHLEQWLGREPAQRPVRIFVVEDKAIWERVVRVADRRKDSLAIQAEDEVFVLRERGVPVDPFRLPHELVHLKLWRRYGDRLPLWLDEGLAGYLGRRAAIQVARGSGSPPPRAGGMMAAEALLSPAEVQAVQSYREIGPAFYRQAEAMVAVVARRTGEEGLGELVSAVAEKGLSWEDFLRQRLKWSGEEIQEAAREITEGRTGRIP